LFNVVSTNNLIIAQGLVPAIQDHGSWNCLMVILEVLTCLRQWTLCLTNKRYV